MFPQYYVPIPAFWPFGLGFIAILFIADITVEVMRGKSPNIISNVGYWSINSTKDIHRIPWHDRYVSVKDEHNKTLGDISIMFPGGIDYWGISVKSSAEHPVLVFPSIYEEKEEECYHVLANLQEYSFGELSPYLRYVLSRFGRRIGKRTKIYFGATSHMDGTAIPANLKIELKERSDNKEISSLEKKLDRLYKEYNREDRRKEKQIFIRKQGEIEED